MNCVFLPRDNTHFIPPIFEGASLSGPCAAAANEMASSVAVLKCFSDLNLFFYFIYLVFPFRLSSLFPLVALEGRLCRKLLINLLKILNLKVLNVAVLLLFFSVFTANIRVKQTPSFRSNICLGFNLAWESSFYLKGSTPDFDLFTAFKRWSACILN